MSPLWRPFCYVFRLRLYLSLLHTPPPLLHVPLAAAGGPTSGRALGSAISGTIRYNVGPRIVCTLLGQSFGLWGTVSFVAFNRTAMFVVPPADVLSWNHTVITFYMPRGYGRGLTVNVTAGGMSQDQYLPAPDRVVFNYDPPVLMVSLSTGVVFLSQSPSCIHTRPSSVLRSLRRL